MTKDNKIEMLETQVKLLRAKVQELDKALHLERTKDCTEY